MQRYQQLQTASSSDNITFLSKYKKTVGETRPNDKSFPSLGSVLYKRVATSSFTSGVTQLSPLLRPRLQKSIEPVQNANSIFNKRRKPILIKSTNFDLGKSDTVVNIDTSSAEKQSSQSDLLYKMPVHVEKNILTASNRRPITVLHLHSKSFDDELLLSSPKYSPSSCRRLQSRNTSPSLEGANVHKHVLKPSNLTNNEAAAVSAKSHCQNGMETGCQTPADNSDSGRESMLDAVDIAIDGPHVAF